MNKFSPSEAALEGFRLTRERPGLIATWAGLYFIGIILMGVVMVASLGPDFVAFIREGGLHDGDTAAFGDLLADSWFAFLAVLAMVLMVWAVLTGGIYRAILRPEEKGVAYLRLGGDEVRLALVHLLLALIGLVFVVAIAEMRRSGQPLLGVAALALSAGMLWVGVRLSLATPLTFYEKRISLGAAWNLTRGCFWRLFGMIVLAVIFYVMVFLLTNVVMFGIVTLAGGTEVVQDMSRLTPATVIALAVTIVVQMLLPILQAVTIYAPFAVAYGELSGVLPPPGLPAED